MDPPPRFEAKNHNDNNWYIFNIFFISYYFSQVNLYQVWII